MPPRKPAPRVSDREVRPSKSAAAKGPVEKPARKPGKAGATLGPVLRGHVETAPEPVDDDTLVAIFARLREADPEPRSELQFQNPYTLLVAVVL